MHLSCMKKTEKCQRLDKSHLLLIYNKVKEVHTEHIYAFIS